MKLGPNIWGPHGWKFIHYTAFAYPNNPTNDIKENYKNFFTILGDVLPCKLCSDHYKENLLLHPLSDAVLSDRDSLFKWTIDIHNEVNKLNNSPIYDYDTVYQLIMTNFNEENKEKEENKVEEKEKETEKTNEKEKDKEKDEDKEESKDNTMLYLFILVLFIIGVIAIISKHKK